MSGNYPENVSGAAEASQAQPRGGALPEDLTSEPVELGRPAAGALVRLARRLDEVGRGDETAEVLLVEHLAGERFHHLLEPGEAEGLRQDLENHRSVGQFPPQALQRG